jgi:murein DD-endopeptidase MepM/ murein hydrolase activator NlpD
VAVRKQTKLPLPSSFKQKINSRILKVKTTWRSNGRFTIHPFRSLHSRHLLPLSLTDYVARFSLEFAVLSLAILAVFANFSLNHTRAVSASDQSVIFSFLKNNPKFNQALLAEKDTTTILAPTDQFVSTALAQSTTSSVLTASQTSSKNPTTIQGEVIVKTNPADTQNFYRHGLTTYKVQSGDTVVSIASSFGISPQTVMMENKIDDSAKLKTGQDLTILPTTGITYTIKAGDTQDAILNKYKITESAFLDANNLESFDDLQAGAVVVIPMDSVNLPVKPKAAPKFVQNDSGKVTLKTAAVPQDFAGGIIDFIWPTPVRTITQGFSSRHTGLDISDSKMEPIYAAADGFVEISGYQTNGYGNTIVINHGSGFKTRYGHASELYVSAGDYVKKGQLIAKQGHTGRVRGATGIHLHFEIIKDGNRVNPLAYVHP